MITLAYQGGTRGSASGLLDSHRSYWWQHEYFAHTGQRGPEKFRYGRWLALDWYAQEQGGFDGRRVSSARKLRRDRGAETRKT